MTSVACYHFRNNILFTAMKRNDALMMHNLRAHHRVGMALLAEQNDVRVFYLPPFFRRSHRIVLVWSTMKSSLRQRQK